MSPFSCQNITRMVSEPLTNILHFWNLLTWSHSVQIALSTVFRIPIGMSHLAPLKDIQLFLVQSLTIVCIPLTNSIVKPVTAISQSLVPSSVLVTLLLLQRDIMTRQHFWNKPFNWGLVDSFRGLVYYIIAGSMAAGTWQHGICQKPG